MAYPVVDEQLATMAMAGKWKNKPIHLDLGTLLLDNLTIVLDKEPYNEMNKDNKADFIQCKVVWDHKIKCELKKRGIKKTGMKLMKYKKWSTIVHVNNSGASVKNFLSINRMSQKKVAEAVKKEDVVEETTKKCVAVDNPMAGLLPLEAMVREPEDKAVECVDCCECPCVLLLKKQEMIYFNQMEQEHLPEEDLPPHNIQRNKLYRQMTLHIQASQVQKGVIHELPNCIEISTHKLFPLPTFMGFKYTEKMSCIKILEYVKPYNLVNSTNVKNLSRYMYISNNMTTNGIIG
jgi:hypothetical protein